MNNIHTTYPSIGVFEITFRSKEGNSLTLSQLHELANLIEQCNDDEKTNTIIIRSQGKTFCSGANFKELLALENKEQAIEFFGGFAKVILSIKNSSKIIVCMIQGKSVGGGLGLIAAADYAIASENAAIKLSELALGIGPFVIGPAVERKIGLSNYSSLALNPDEWKSAQWASQSGLYQEIVRDNELEKVTYTYVDKVSKLNPTAMTLFKKSLWENTDHWEQLLSKRAELSAQLVLSDNCQNKLNSFFKN
ncbi:MAG: enoyl-CoA hydratase/isomerase family protein [Reichenbachiella sp.]